MGMTSLRTTIMIWTRIVTRQTRIMIGKTPTCDALPMRCRQVGTEGAGSHNAFLPRERMEGAVSLRSHLPLQWIAELVGVPLLVDSLNHRLRLTPPDQQSTTAPSKPFSSWR